MRKAYIIECADEMENLVLPLLKSLPSSTLKVTPAETLDREKVEGKAPDPKPIEKPDCDSDCPYCDEPIEPLKSIDHNPYFAVAEIFRKQCEIIDRLNSEAKSKP